jgi:hypothetical protein
VRLKRSSPFSPDPHGVVLPYEACRRTRSRYSVTAPATPFRRPRGLPESGFTDAEATVTPIGLDPLQGSSVPLPPKVIPSGNLHEVRRPYSDMSNGGPQFPGFQPRFVPPSEFLTLLTAFSLQSLPATRTGTTHGVHPSELSPLTKPCAFRRLYPHAVSDIALFCSEDQKATMPRSSRAFFSERVRFRSGRSPTGSMLSWVSLAPLQSSTRVPWDQLPDPFPHALFTTPPEGEVRAALQGLTSTRACKAFRPCRLS